MEIDGKRIAILAGDEYEDLELHYPRLRLTEAGAEVEILGDGKEVYQSKTGYPAKADREVSESDPGKFDAVVIPGGYAPDPLRDRPIRRRH